MIREWMKKFPNKNYWILPSIIFAGIFILVSMGKQNLPLLVFVGSILTLICVLSIYVLFKRESPHERLNSDQFQMHLREILVKNFSIGELKDLAFNLGVDYEIIEGDGKGNKAREIIRYFKRRGELQVLFEYCLINRPNAKWWDSQENIISSIQTSNSNKSDNLQSFKYSSQQRLFAILGITISLLVTTGIAIFWPVHLTLAIAEDVDSINSNTNPTEIPLPTETAISFPTATVDENLVVILPFFITADGSSNLHNRIFEEIEQTRKELSLENMRVQIDPNVVLELTDRNKAQAVGERHNATIIIWGEETATAVFVNFLNIKEPEGASSDERVEVYGREASARLINQDLPEQLAFLSLFTVGQAVAINGNFTKAIPILEKAVGNISEGLIGINLGASPDPSVAAYFLLGWLYQVHEGNNELAVDNYSRAIENKQDFKIAYYNRGIAHFDLENFEEASIDFETSVQVDATFAQGYYNLGNSYRLLNQIDDAIESFDQAILLNPSFAEAFYARGYIYFFEQNYEASILDFSTVIELKNDQLRLDAFFGRGQAYNNQNVFQLAIEDFGTIIESLPEATLEEQYSALMNRGHVFEKLGNYGLAIADYKTAIDLDSQNANAFNALAWLYVDKLEKELDEAISLAQNAIILTEKNNPEDKLIIASYLDTLGWAYYKAGQPEIAIEKLSQALELCQNEVEVCIEINTHLNEVKKGQR